jgi:hypothetical protein
MTTDEPSERPSLCEVDEWDGGISWIAHPDEDAQRASHALVTDAGIWIVDPVDADGLDDQFAELGEVAGVAVLQDRHTRDSTVVARRHDVPVYIPDWMELGREKLETTAELIESELPSTNYTVHQLIATEDWEEAVLVNEKSNTMVVPEALGTLPAFQVNDNELGVHPALDDPPQRLTGWSPDRILVGHGKSIHTDATTKLQTAIEAE